MEEQYKLCEGWINNIETDRYVKQARMIKMSKEISPYRINAKPLTKTEEQYHLDWLETVYIPERYENDHRQKTEYLETYAKKSRKRLIQYQETKEGLLGLITIIFVACSLTLFLGWKWEHLSDGLKTAGIIASIIFTIGVIIAVVLWNSRNHDPQQ